MPARGVDMYSHPKSQKDALLSGAKIYSQPLLLAGALHKIERLAQRKQSLEKRQPKAGPSCVVDLLDLQDNSNARLTLVMPRDADPAKWRISVLSPLGSSLLGLKKGDTSKVQLGRAELKFRIQNIYPL